MTTRLSQPVQLAQLDPTTQAVLEARNQTEMAAVYQQSEQGRGDLIARLYCAGVDRSSIANKTTPRLLVARGIVRQQT